MIRNASRRTGTKLRRRRQPRLPAAAYPGGVYGFARKMMGDEALAYAFYDDPNWCTDIMDTYTDRGHRILGESIVEPFWLKNTSQRRGAIFSQMRMTTSYRCP